MLYPYGMQGAPAVGGGLGGLPRKKTMQGALQYKYPMGGLITTTPAIEDVCYQVKFSPDGTKVFWNSATTIYQKTLVIPFDLRTAGAVTSFVVSASGNIIAFTISDDGTHLYYHNYAQGLLFHYLLRVPFDITSYTGLTTLSTATQSKYMYGMQISADGRNAYFVDPMTRFSENRSIFYQAKMSIPFDLTTAVFLPPTSLPIYSTPYALHVTRDGSYLFINDGGVNQSMGIYGYQLTTPYMLSTATNRRFFRNAVNCLGFNINDNFMNSKGLIYLYWFENGANNIVCEEVLAQMEFSK